MEEKKEKDPQFKIFKKNRGQAQFNLCLSPSGFEGMRGIMIEAACTKDGEPDRTDWDKKIRMLLGPIDLGKLIIGLRNERDRTIP